MIEDIRGMLDRQAEWQRRRADLPWAEKLRRSVIMRKTFSAFHRNQRPAGVRGAASQDSPKKR